MSKIWMMNLRFPERWLSTKYGAHRKVIYVFSTLAKSPREKAKFVQCNNVIEHTVLYSWWTVDSDGKVEDYDDENNHGLIYLILVPILVSTAKGTLHHSKCNYKSHICWLVREIFRTVVTFALSMRLKWRMICWRVGSFLFKYEI